MMRVVAENREGRIIHEFLEAEAKRQRRLIEEQRAAQRRLLEALQLASRERLGR